jgi:hypothetical protein
VPERVETSGSHPITRVADSGEDAMRNLVALPLRIMAGALGIGEALLRTAADAITEGDSIEQRLADLQGRMDSLEEQATSRKASSATSAARRGTPAGSETAADPRGP